MVRKRHKASVNIKIALLPHAWSQRSSVNRLFSLRSGGYGQFSGLKTYNKQLKTLIALGGWNEGSKRLSPLVADAARRRAFVKSAVRFLRQYNFDGLDLDWEYPASRSGGKPEDRDNYVKFVAVRLAFASRIILGLLLVPSHVE